MEKLILQKKARRYYLLYSICFFIGSICIFSPFLLDAKSLVLAGDGYNQFLPSLFYIKQYIIDFFNGSGLKAYDWKVGYGENLIYALNYYGFGNPFSLIVCLVPKQYLAFGYTVIIIVKLYVAGLSCSYYLKKRQVSNLVTMTIAMMYVFSSSSLLGSIRYPVFLDSIISFPLIIGGIEDYTRKKEMPLCLVLGVFYQSLSGFYFLYIELILAGIYYLICSKSVSIKEFIVNGCKCLGCVFWGLCLGGVVFFQTVVGYLHCSRTGSNLPIELSFFDFRFILEIVKNLFFPKSGVMYTIPVIAFLICVNGMVNLKREKEKKIMLSILLIGLSIPGFGSALNGFSIVENARWSFAIIFFAGTIIADELHNNEGNSKLSIFMIIIGVVNIIYCVLECLDKITINKIIVCIGYITIIVVSYILFKIKKNTKLCCLVILINILVNGLLINISDSYGGIGQNAAYHSYKSINSMLEDEFSVQISEQSEDKEIFRTDVIQDNLNIALYSGKANCAAYFSVLNNNLYNFYCKYGLMPVAGNAKHLLKGLDNRTILEDIFSVKYYRNNGMSSEEQVVIENDDYCNIGLIYEKYYSENDFERMSMLERQSALTQGVVLKNEIINGQVTKINHTEEIVPYELDYEENVDVIENYYTVKDGCKMTLILPENNYLSPEYEMYVHIQHAELVSGTAKTNLPNISINGKKVLIPDRTYAYWTGETEVWLNTPISHENNIEILFPYEGTYLLEGIEVYYYNVQEQKMHLKELKQNKFEVLKMDADLIEGYVEDGEGKVLVLGIPFEKGWMATINGKETECLNANNGLLGVKLQEGKNEVIFSYHTPGEKLFLAITSVCWIGLIVYYKKKRMRWGRNNEIY